jgi:hypothetical protein
MKIRVNGYVCEIVCGQIPRTCKDVFTAYILEHRDDSRVPDGIRTRNPDYVTPEQIKELWYQSDDVMGHLLSECGFAWQGYRGVNDLHHLHGFGSGKQGIGIFDISVFVQDRLASEFVPFDPPEDGNRYLQNLQNIPHSAMDPLTLSKVTDPMVAISAGTWAKGTMEFEAHLDAPFDPAVLAILVVDATQIGIGEDHLVVGLSYRSTVLPGHIVRETDKEMYPVSWYSPEQGRWLDMWEG